MMEMFQGVLTLYYSAEVCHSLRGKDFNNMQHIVDDMEAAWNPDHTQSIPRCTELQPKRRLTTGDSSGPDLEMHSLQREQVGA